MRKSSLLVGISQKTIILCPWSLITCNINVLSMKSLNFEITLSYHLLAIYLPILYYILMQFWKHLRTHLHKYLYTYIQQNLIPFIHWFREIYQHQEMSIIFRIILNTSLKFLTIVLVVLFSYKIPYIYKNNRWKIFINWSRAISLHKK